MVCNSDHSDCDIHNVNHDLLNAGMKMNNNMISIHYLLSVYQQHSQDFSMRRVTDQDLSIGKR